MPESAGQNLLPSATVTRKDGHHPIIFMNCGPVRYKVDDKKQAAERPFAHKVIVRETNFRMPASFEADQYTAIHEIYNALLQSDERNQIIVADVMKAIEHNRFPVILTERKEHLEALKSLLENKITKSNCHERWNGEKAAAGCSTRTSISSGSCRESGSRHWPGI